MTAFRRVPRVEGRAAAADLGRALLFGALGVAAWVAVHSYWPAEVTEPDEATRERIVRFVAGGAAVVAVLFLAQGLFHAVRWLQARRWERMLDDPARAHFVPPLAAHVAAVPSKASRRAVLGACVLLPLVGLALVAIGVLGRTGRIVIENADGQDLSGSFLGIGIFLTLLTIPAVGRARRWLLADRVERLSSDVSLAPPAPVAAQPAPRALAIPHLDVAFHTEDHDGGRARLAALWSTLAADDPPDIMYFRLFENAAGTERFVRGWRTLGNVYLLRSSDQVTAEELEAAEATGSVASMFITTPAQLEAALVDARVGRDELPPAPQAYPQRALLCHGNFWKTAVELLLQRMDLVMVDLTGFGLENTGTAYELQRVIDTFPIERVTLLADRTSDQPFLAAQVRAVWSRMAEGSPNAGGGARTVHVELANV